MCQSILQPLTLLKLHFLSWLCIGGLIFLQDANSTPLPSASNPLPSESPSSFTNLEENARKERGRIEELIRSRGLKSGSYPPFTVSLKGGKVITLNSFRMVLRLCLIYRVDGDFCLLLNFGNQGYE